MIRCLLWVLNFTLLDLGIFGDIIFVKRVSQKQYLYVMFPTKCLEQNDSVGRAVISCVCQQFVFSIVFAIKTSIFKLPDLLCFFV